MRKLVRRDGKRKCTFQSEKSHAQRQKADKMHGDLKRYKS